ncbi:glycosyltransferase family 2 protein [Mucisphaera sp.]|uniref:glycosyltransferase family 2 protein n=1 Tax=Mucisphaera sp. TaxID=2913024 RepID=UPI003D0ACA1C
MAEASSDPSVSAASEGAGSVEVEGSVGVRVLAVVLNYRTPDLVVDCLGSLVSEVAGCPGLSVVVVDNDSGDGSAEAIERTIDERGWGAWARVHRMGDNRGFSAGNNGGLFSGEAEYYLLLNSDTLVGEGAVRALLRGAEAHPGAGLIGPRLTWRDGTPQISSFQVPTPVTELVHAAATGFVSRLFARHVIAPGLPEAAEASGWVSFAAVLVSARALGAVGPMDEGFFMYFEDIDYARRVRRAGFEVLYWPEARVVHLRGQSSPVKEAQQQGRRRPAYFYAARSRYYAKYYGVAGLWLANVLWHVGRCVSWTRERLGRRERVACASEWRDIWTSALRPMRPFEMKRKRAG